MSTGSALGVAGGNPLSTPSGGLPTHQALTIRLGCSGGYGKCLDNTPYKDYIADSPAANKLPGEAFTEDRQCELVFGRGSKICSYMVRTMCYVTPEVTPLVSVQQ